MTDSFVIETHNLSKRYGSHLLAVDRVNMRISPGEIYGFLGPNGAGKTTTLRMLLGLVRPSAGTARVLGRSPGDSQGLARLGAIVETRAFYLYLSGRDNLRFLARHAGATDVQVETALTQVDLAQRGEDKFRTYSLGMKQRLGIAAALLKEPELLILDEPTNGLDPGGMAEMRALIRRLGRDGRTVLLSSHQLGEVEQVCDRVGVINGGKRVAEGTVDALRGGGGLRVRAQPAADAEELLATYDGRIQVKRLDDGAFMVAIDPSQSARINRLLMDAGVEVSELTPVLPSLEDVFLTLTQKEG